VRSAVIRLGRSMVRFSWAMTVFGAQQTARLVAPSSRGAAGASAPAEAFDAVASAMEGQFGGVFRGAYETGRGWLAGRRGAERPASN
jgi:hypothetical protein